MSNPEETYQKRYYSIGEVAEMFDVSKSLIRFWESEFDTLKPHKNSKGDRRFTPRNIEQLRSIYDLVKGRGFTLEGAKKELSRIRDHEREKAKIINRLQEVRALLETLKQQL